MSRRTALALSGGGHRACVFALGVFMYLADAGRQNEIVSIASVSGGSLTNGAVAQAVDLRTCSREQLNDATTRIARCVAGRGTLFGARVTWLYLCGLVILAAADLVGSWFLPIALGFRILVFLAGVFIVAEVAAIRGWVCGRAFGATLFSPNGGRPTELADINTGVDHVICATELHAGENVYFSGRFVSSYRFGFGKPGKLPLHIAVQASAAFPGGFPATWLRTRRFGFVGGQPEARDARSMALHDGGVYDNMGDQWMQGMSKREKREENLEAHFQDAEELVVVSASAGLKWGGIAWLGVPLVGELLTLLRDKSILYDNGNSVRREELVARFDLAERERRGLRGALVHISQSPFAVPTDYADAVERWPERASRARQALELLNDDVESASAWAKVTELNAAVPTTLLGLGADVTARLLHHAYVLAMVNLHVLLDFPLLELPTRERFASLL
jgi:predicted acylesterase/phospholipase RssA